MSLSAIFRFENLDSTKDLNDLYQYLFNKGVYWWDTTSQTNLIVASGASLNVTVAPFRALSYDGMHILSDSSITLALSSSKSYKIVCKAKYLYEDTPYIKVSAMTDVQIAADPESDYYIVLSDVSTAAAVPAIDFNNTDLISEIGYDPYKGYYDSADEIETNSLTRAGDFCFVSNPSGDPAVIMYIYSGSEWVKYGDTESIATDLTIHKANGDTGITPVTIAFNEDGVVGEVYDPGCLHVSLNMLNAMRWFGTGETPASRTNRFVTQSSPYALTVSLQGACAGNRPSATNPSGVPSATNPFVVSNTPIAIETDIAVTTSASESNYITLPCVAWNGSSTTASPGFFVGFGSAGTAQEYFDLLSTLDGVLTNSAGEVIAIEGVYTKSGSVYTELNPSTSASAYGYWWQNGASLYLKVGKSGTGLIDSSGAAKVKCYIRSSYGLGDIAGDMSSSSIKSPSVQRIYKCGLREFGAIHFDSAKSYNSAETTTVSINPTTIVFDDTATTNYVKSNTINSGSTSIEETYAIPAGGSEVYSSLLTKNILSLERTSSSQAGSFSSHIYLNNPSLFECYYNSAPWQSLSTVNTMTYTFASGALSLSKVYDSVTYRTTINPGSIVVSNPDSFSGSYPGETSIIGAKISLTGNNSRIDASGKLFIASTQVSIDTPYLIATTTNINISATDSLIMRGSNSVSISSHAVTISGTGSGGTADVAASATTIVGTSSVTIESASVTITAYATGIIHITGPSLSVTTTTTNISCSGTVSIESTAGGVDIIALNAVSLHSTNGTAYVTGDDVTITANATSGANILLNSSSSINTACLNCTLNANSNIGLTAPIVTLTGAVNVVSTAVFKDSGPSSATTTIGYRSISMDDDNGGTFSVIMYPNSTPAYAELRMENGYVIKGYTSGVTSYLQVMNSIEETYSKLEYNQLNITDGTALLTITSDSLVINTGSVNAISLSSSGRITCMSRSEDVHTAGDLQTLSTISTVGARLTYYYPVTCDVTYYGNTDAEKHLTPIVGNSLEWVYVGGGLHGWWSPVKG